jgi:hypothetical protein
VSALHLAGDHEDRAAVKGSREGELTLVGCVRLVFHGGLEAANTVSDSFAEFRQLLRSEDEQSNSENYQQMHGLKQSFKHKCSFGKSKSRRCDLI